MTVKRFSTLILTLTTAVLAGCRSHDQFTTESQLVPPNSFVREWASDPEFKQISTPVRVNDMLFIHGEDNLVGGYSLDGSLKFRAHVGNGFDKVGEPMFQEEHLVFPVSSGLEIYSLDGTPLKHIPYNLPIRSPGVLVGKTVYIGVDSTQGGRIAALALDEAYVPARWTRLAGGLVNTKPAYIDKNLYVATESGSVFSISLEPNLNWPRSSELKDQIFHTDGKIHAAIKADDYGIYIPSSDTKLYCIDRSSGKVRWEYISGESLKTSPQVSSDMVYIYIRRLGLVAINKKHNDRFVTPQWTFADGAKVLSDDAKNAYILTTQGKIVAVDKKTGVVQFSTGDVRFIDGIESFDPKNSMIYAITQNGSLVAIRPVTTAGVVGPLVSLDSQSTIATADR